MSNKIPNGNIIVDVLGRYNRFDAGAHQHMFDRIKGEYVIGEVTNSRFLTAEEIEALAPDFVPMLQRVFNSQGMAPIDLISRYGQTLSPAQVHAVLEWVNG